MRACDAPLDTCVADIVGFPKAECFGSNDTGEVVPSEEDQQDDDEFKALTEHNDDDEGDEEEWHCEGEVHGSHCDLVNPSAAVSGHEPDDGAADSSS